MKFAKFLPVYLKGIAMGAADVVPGVSGGTVAFITGIYDELLHAISAMNITALRLLLKREWKTFWTHIHGTFLLCLFLGIVSSYLALAHLISYLLENHDLLVWSFFMGLILASALHILRQIDGWNIARFSMLLLGLVLAVTLSYVRPTELPAEPLYVFLCACVAICAMILPGISGSFILLILGMYEHVITAIKSLDLVLIASFGAGCGVGLLSFSHVLSWLLDHYRALTLSLLTGFLFGSLTLIWPWKETLVYRINSKGESVPLVEQNILPQTYADIAQQDPQTVFCFALMVLGWLIVVMLERHMQVKK